MQRNKPSSSSFLLLLFFPQFQLLPGKGRGERRTVPADPDRGGEDVKSTRGKKDRVGGKDLTHRFRAFLRGREKKGVGGCRRRENNLAGTNGRRGGGGTKMRLPSLPTDPFSFPRWKCSQPGMAFFSARGGHSILATSEMAISTPPLHTSSKRGLSLPAGQHKQRFASGRGGA